MAKKQGFWEGTPDFGTDATYLEFLRIAKHPKGEQFRQFVIQMKTGISPIEYAAAMGDADFVQFYDTLSKLGVMKPRVQPLPI
jgi:hypothetical protein